MKKLFAVKNMSRQFLLDMVDACEAAYDPATWATRDVASRSSVPIVYTDASRGSCVLVSEGYGRHAATLVAFRGTDELLDLFYDAMAFEECASAKGENFRVHAGFMRQYRSLERHVPVDEKPKIFVGHSSGGAQAAIAAALYPRSENVSCVTFGAPRVGDDAFVRLFERDVCGFAKFRVRDRADVVTALPSAGCGYRHAPSHECQLFAENSLWWQMAERFLCGSAWAHGLESYRRGVLEL